MAIHGKSREKVIDALRNELPYKGGSALRIVKRFEGWGRYPEAGPTASADGYVNGEPVDGSTIRTYVYSYATPIAWVYHDGTVCVPAHRYSPTTTNHQTLCRAYLAQRKV